MHMTATFSRFALALFFVSMTVAVAQAGGGSLKDEPYRHTWTGAYIGLTAGTGWGDSQFDDTVRSNPFDIDGFVLGGTIGYNLQLQRGIVIGVEADISYSNISGRFGPGNLGAVDGGGWGCGTGPCVTEVNWFGTVRGRIGLADNRFLLYATGGLAFGDIDSAILNDPDWITGNTSVGWTAGAGIEYVLVSGWTAKIEYLHVDLGWTDRNAASDFKADAVFDIVRAGLNYRFSFGY